MYQKAKYCADDVAEIVIRYSNERKYPISNLKLQKVLYFIQAIFLTEKKRECFKEEIEAWTFGPVVPSVYQKYKLFGANNIPASACNKNSLVNLFSSTNNSFNKVRISDEDEKEIQDIVDSLSKYSATELVEITHNQSPWAEAYIPRLNRVISSNAILNYFSNK